MSDVASVVDGVSESLGQSVTLHGELDVDVYRLRPTGAGGDVVARAFGADVEPATVNAAAHVLSRLAGTAFPAERPASDAPIVQIGDRKHLLITRYVEPLPPPRAGFVLAWCAGLLGRLAGRSGDDLPAGGGWHRLGTTPEQEVDEALRLGGQVGPSVSELLDVLADADDGAGLPEALIHPDLMPANAIPQGDQAPVVIDWIGVGRGPRIWPLAFLLFAGGPRATGRLLDRYTRTIALSAEERHRLAGVMIARPLTLDLWSVAYERTTPREANMRCREHRARINAVTTAVNDYYRP